MRGFVNWTGGLPGRPPAGLFSVFSVFYNSPEYSDWHPGIPSMQQLCCCHGHGASSHWTTQCTECSETPRPSLKKLCLAAAEQPRSLSQCEPSERHHGNATLCASSSRSNSAGSHGFYFKLARDLRPSRPSLPLSSEVDCAEVTVLPRCQWAAGLAAPEFKLGCLSFDQMIPPEELHSQFLIDSSMNSSFTTFQQGCCWKAVFRD